MLNNQRLKVSYFVFVLITIILGTLLHFAYEWSGQNIIVSFLAPVNESPWEHLKLLFFPFLFCMIPEYFLIGYAYPNYVYSCAIGILCGMTLTLVIFYTYSGILGKNILFLDIASFILGVIAAYYISYTAMVEEYAIHVNGQRALGFLLLGIIAAAFILFTNHAPSLALFDDPTACIFTDHLTKKHAIVSLSRLISTKACLFFELAITGFPVHLIL